MPSLEPTVTKQATFLYVFKRPVVRRNYNKVFSFTDDKDVALPIAVIKHCSMPRLKITLTICKTGAPLSILRRNSNKWGFTVSHHKRAIALNQTCRSIESGMLHILALCYRVNWKQHAVKCFTHDCRQ
jgi:hypothetical protein